MARARSFEIFRIAGYPWLLANAFSISASWMIESLALGWLVLQLTDSPFWVGVASGVRGISQLVCSMLGGTLADRLDRRRLLLASNLGSACLALAVAILIQAGDVRLWEILVCTALGGGLGSVRGPAYDTLTYDVVGPEWLLNATSYRFLAGGVVRLVAAISSGLVIAGLGVGPAYFLVALTTFAAAACLLPVPSPARRARAVAGADRSFRAGLRYALRTPPVRELLVLSILTETLGFSGSYMRPVMARDVLHVGAVGLGYLEAAASAGQLAAMVALANVRDAYRKTWLLVGAAAGFGLTIALFGISPWFSMSLVIVAVGGGMSSVYDSMMSTITQLTAGKEMRGRVQGLYVSTWGFNQLGGLGLGALGTVVSVPFALALGGSMLAVSAARSLTRITALKPARSPSP